MAHFDVFNGDADGICALHQLRLARPLDARLVTGTKRDIALLARVDAGAGDSVTVLDVSLESNRTDLLALLERGATVDYFDHHFSGEVPTHPGLFAVIDGTPSICTGIIVHRWLGGIYPLWAAVAAFGDNFAHTAHSLLQPLKLPAAKINALRELGEYLNYNAYGDTEADLVMHPAALYALLHCYADPFVFIDSEPVFQVLRQSRSQDLKAACRMPAHHSSSCGSIVILPDTAWSRRVRGTYGNLLASRDPALAHAILTPDGRGGYTVSIRAPLTGLRGADLLSRRFPGGGGRPAAAGINHLLHSSLEEFIAAFEHVFCSPP